MIKTLMKSAALLALLLPVTQALAAPVCGDTPKMAELKAHWHDPAGPVMIASHRGGHLHAPENSLAAVDEAVSAGADILEIDVRVSSDGVPFIMHDSTVDRTTNGSGTGEDMTYGQLRALRLDGGETPPPSLLEMLRQSCGRILVDLDMKTDRVAPVIAVVEGLGMLDQVMLFDSDSQVLRRARELAPDVPVMTRLREDVPMEEKNRGLFPIAIVHGDMKTLTAPVTRAILDMPARIWANSLGNLDHKLPEAAASCAGLDALQDRGVSVIQTDYPQLLRARLSVCQKGSSSAE